MRTLTCPYKLADPPDRRNDRLESLMKENEINETEVRTSVGSRIAIHFKKYWQYHLMLLIPVIFFIIFCYWPMFGVSMAFQDYEVGAPFLGPDTKWVGLKWFKMLVSSRLFPRLLRNTLLISLYDLAIGFPICILFALMLNEVRLKRLRKFTANVSLLPWFISTVVVVAVLDNFFSLDDGIINNIIEKLGGTRKLIVGNPDWFRTLYIGSGIWQGCGYGAVVFTAAIAGIDPVLYEAAAIDGSTRFKNIFKITIPCILPTILIMLILRFGGLMSVGATKILLMYRPLTYETADVFGTYAYRIAFMDGKMSYSAAVDLFTSLVNLALLLLANFGSKKFCETALF